jgi:Rhodopirellula transposase DDE domain
MGTVTVTGEMLAAKFGTILPHLDERQRRLLLGAEARALGHGGIRLVAAAAGVREATVSLGVRELESGAEPLGRARRPGGGRKRAAEIDPQLVPALLALVEPDERGDPVSPLRWTTKSTRTLAGELTAQGHTVSADTVGDLLRGKGFSLQANAKTIEGKQHPDRDGQFRYISTQAKDHLDAGDPVISVDTKKKELIGQYRNAGRQWRPRGEPVAVADHDFPGPQVPRAIPYGIYDLAANTGWVNVGTDGDTAQFAVESVRRWWHGAGAAAYPGARRLLVTADAGGANSYRTRAWKTGLAALAAETGLEITCCHFPPGTSKWNKTGHRLFAHITMNWRGRPLTSHQVAVNTIAATTTRAGLRVHAQLDTGLYPTGVKISDTVMAALPLARHGWHGEWNYTLAPQPAPTPAPPPPAPPPRPSLDWLAHPALTGLTRNELTALITAAEPGWHAHQELKRYRYRGGPRRHRPGGGGRNRALDLTGQLLATALNQHLSLPHHLIAALTGVDPTTISHAISDIRTILGPRLATIPPAPQRLRTLNDLRTYANTAGITLPPPAITAS